MQYIRTLSLSSSEYSSGTVKLANALELSNNTFSKPLINSLGDLFKKFGSMEVAGVTTCFVHKPCMITWLKSWIVSRQQCKQAASNFWTGSYHQLKMQPLCLIAQPPKQHCKRPLWQLTPLGQHSIEVIHKAWHSRVRSIRRHFEWILKLCIIAFCILRSFCSFVSLFGFDTWFIQWNWMANATGD